MNKSAEPLTISTADWSRTTFHKEIRQPFFNLCAFYVHTVLITNLNTLNYTAAGNVTTALRFPVAGARSLDLCPHTSAFIDHDIVFIYHTNRVLFHGGLQLLFGLRSDVSMSRHLWLLLSVHFDNTQTPNPLDEFQGYGEHP